MENFLHPFSTIKTTTIMQDKDTITDVEFKEVLPEPTGGTEEPKEIFNPVVYLTTALVNAGFHDPAGWAKGCDPRAAEAAEEKDRIFFANRALRLYLAEVPDRENISPRMLLADGITSVQWCALIDQGIVPWLMNQFDSKGKRVITAKEDPELVAKINAMAPGENFAGDNSSDDTSLDAWRVRGEEAGAEMMAANGDPSGEVGTTSDNPIPSGAPGVSGEVNIGVDYAAAGAEDQTAVNGEVISAASEDKPVDWGQVAPSEPQKFPPADHVEEMDDARPSSVDPE